MAHIKIEIEDDNEDKNQDNVSTLMIATVKPQNAGEYSITISNDEEEPVTKAINVQVVG